MFPTWDKHPFLTMSTPGKLQRIRWRYPERFLHRQIRTTSVWGMFVWGMCQHSTTAFWTWDKAVGRVVGSQNSLPERIGQPKKTQMCRLPLKWSSRKSEKVRNGTQGVPKNHARSPGTRFFCKSMPSTLACTSRTRAKRARMFKSRWHSSG